MPPQEPGTRQHRISATLVLLAKMDEAQVGSVRRAEAARRSSPAHGSLRPAHGARMEQNRNRIQRVRRGSLVPLVRQDGDDAALRITAAARNPRHCKESQEAVKVLELPTLDRRSPLLECENCGRQSLICHLHRRGSSKRLSCHCGKDSIILPQNASDWKITRNIEHEATCEPIGRDGLGDFSLPNTPAEPPPVGSGESSNTNPEVR